MKMGKTYEQAIHTESIKKSQKIRKRIPSCGNNWRTVNLHIKDVPALRSCGKTRAGLVPDGEMYRDGPPPLRLSGTLVPELWGEPGFSWVWQVSNPVGSVMRPLPFQVFSIEGQPHLSSTQRWDRTIIGKRGHVTAHDPQPSLGDGKMNWATQVT